MSSQPSSSASDSTPIQNTITPVPAPAPVQEIIPASTEMEEAKKKYNEQQITFAELVRTHKRVIVQNSRKGIKTREEMVQWPLSFFSFQNGILTCADYTRVKPLPPVDKSKLPKNIREAKDMLRRKKLNVQELRTAITDIGTNNEDSFIFWNPDTDTRPGLNGNNKSRVGFLKDCNFNLAGAYLQGVIKKAILAAINMAHRDWRNQYDKDAFVYEDPYLIYLDAFLKKYIDEHIPEKASYREYHQDLFNKVIDLALGLQKEDVLYRVMGKDILNTLAGKVLFPLTPEEQEHFDLWCIK